MSIVVNVLNQKMYISSDADCLVAGSQQFVKFKFNLSQEWDDLLVFAQFRQGNVAYNYYLDDENCVFLPKEIGAGVCTLMLYGTLDSVIGTTNYLTLKIGENHLISDAGSTDISPSLYAQLIAEMEAIVKASGGTGKLTEQGGEILNDYENNKALSPYSQVSGFSCRAGIYGYKLLSVTPNESNTAFDITVDDSKPELENNRAINNYSTDDLLCFDGVNHLYDSLKITSIKRDSSGKSVISVVSVDGTELTGVEVDSSTDEWENWVYVLAKPFAGEPAKIAYGAYAGGIGSVSVGYGAFAHGENNQSIGKYAYTAGRKNVAHYAGYAKGYNNKALGENSSAQGSGNTVTGTSADADGMNNNVSGKGAHAQNSGNTASGVFSTVSGLNNTASGETSDAGGNKSKASGSSSFARGVGNEASGVAAVALGNNTKATGRASLATGYLTKAKGKYSTAIGLDTVAAGNNQHVQGKYNVEDTPDDTGLGKYAHIVGGGKSDTNRKNIYALDWDGNAEFAGEVKVGPNKEVLAKLSQIPSWARQPNPPSYDASSVGAVPTTRKVNDKPLSADISLNASDVGARPATWTPSASDVGAVPVTRTINHKMLSSDIILSASDVGAIPDTWLPTLEGLDSVVNTNMYEYGLGTNEPTELKTLADVDNYKTSGWARVALSSEYLEGVLANGTLIVDAGDKYIRQTFIADHTYIAQHIELVRLYVYNLNKWGSWEWVNPPLLPGVEYKTTERYRGDAVYVKLVSLGKPEVSLSKGQSKAYSVLHNIENYNYMVRCEGRLAGKPLPWQSVDGVVALAYDALTYDTSSSTIWVKFFARDGDMSISNHSCYVTIYYTKK